MGIHLNLRNLSLVSFLLTLLSCQAEQPPSAEADLIPDQYIVVLKKSVPAEYLQSLSDEYSVQAHNTYSSGLKAGVYRMSKSEAKTIAKDSRVAYVEQDRIIRINRVQANVTWGLDRIDQHQLPLNRSYSYPEGGALVNAYVIDTGIKINHQDFTGRAVHAIDLVDNDQEATDCNGHGTHVAGTIGSQTFGVAKNVKLYAVRVLDCMGSGTLSGVIAGIDWVTAHHIKPAVANLSLGGPISQAVDDAVAASIQAGVTYVVAAGNENQAACNASPARVAAAITVGSTTATDARSSFSNYGECVDVFAPGSDIESLGISSPTATETLSGTSMASPHVAGVAAIYLSLHPQASPSEVSSTLMAQSTGGKVTSAGTGSPNRLISTVFMNGGSGETPTPPTPPPSVGSKLENNVAVNQLAGAKSSELEFSFEVPANAQSVLVQVSGGTGDVDMYVKKGSKVTSSNYDCRPYKSGNEESCSLASSASNSTVYILLKAYAAFSGVSIKASYVAAGGGANPNDPAAPCSGCANYSESLNNKGDFDDLPSGGSYAAKAGAQQIWLQGPAGADFDLYLYKQQGNSWVQVAKSDGSSAKEQLNYQGAAGTYRVRVSSYSGAGTYSLWLKVP